MVSRKITMQDIADKLGVSKVTVSKALKGHEDISESMKEKIIETAKEMGYVYNSVGKMLRENLTYSIGVISSDKFYGKGDHFYIDLYKHLSNYLEKLNFTTMFTILSPSDEKKLLIPKMIQEQKVDGIIILGQLSKEYIEKVVEYDYPLMFLDFYYDKFNVDCVITDNFFATYQITNMLIENGHRKIGYVGNVNLTSSIQDRFLGYYKSILEYGLEFREDWIIKDRNDQNEWIDMRLPDDMPTAFVCNCDKTAYFFIEKLKEYGYRVPEDVSVVGFDDSMHAKMSNPQITTVKVDLEEMGSRTAKLIVDKVKNADKHYGRTLIKGKLKVRSSVKKIN